LFCCLQIDDELKLHRLFDWNVTGLSPLVRAVLGDLYARTGRIADGFGLLQEALTAIESMRGGSSWDTSFRLHLGEAYRVLSLDLGGRVALVEPFAGDYYTQTKRETTTVIEETRRAERRLGLELAFGDVTVTEQVIAFQKRSVATGGVLGLAPLDLPPQTFTTEAVWFCPEPWQLEGHEQMPALLGTLHATEHALIALLPLWAMCDRWDIGGLSTNVHFQTGRPTIFVYDGHPGGVGIAERGFERFEGWVADTAALLAGCPCERGCPSCVQSPKCGNLNEPLDKAAAVVILRGLLAHPEGQVPSAQGKGLSPHGGPPPAISDAQPVSGGRRARRHRRHR